MTSAGLAYFAQDRAIVSRCPIVPLQRGDAPHIASRL